MRTSCFWNTSINKVLFRTPMDETKRFIEHVLADASRGVRKDREDRWEHLFRCVVFIESNEPEWLLARLRESSYPVQNRIEVARCMIGKKKAALLSALEDEQRK